MKLEGLSSIRKVAQFLGTEEEVVTRLLEEDRLGGTLVAALGQRGVPVTPNVKTSVETIVRSIAPKHENSASASESAYLLESGATVTIMFTDVVDSAGITELLGDRQARDVIGDHNEIVRRQTKKHGGVEVKSLGDGFMLTFPSARLGVACAVAIQTELASPGGENHRIQPEVRMGLSVGEPIREEQDLFGKSVILASRISSIAEGGQVLVSQIVHALVANVGEYALKEVGALRLKGISGTHMVYEVAWRQP